VPWRGSPTGKLISPPLGLALFLIPKMSELGPFLVEFAHFASGMHKCKRPMIIIFRETKVDVYLTHMSFLQIKFLDFSSTRNISRRFCHFQANYWIFRCQGFFGPFLNGLTEVKKR
jgi:hypothetical protein